MLYLMRKKWLLTFIAVLFFAALLLLVLMLLFPVRDRFFDAWYV